MVKYESARLDYLETQKEESSANTTAAASRVSQLESELRKTRMEMALIEEDLAESERVVKQYEEKEFEGSKSFPEAVKTYSNKTTTVTLRDFTADSHTQTLKEYIKFERIAEVLDETTTVLEEVKRVNQVQKQVSF